MKAKIIKADGKDFNLNKCLSKFTESLDWNYLKTTYPDTYLMEAERKLREHVVSLMRRMSFIVRENF